MSDDEQWQDVQEAAENKRQIAIDVQNAIALLRREGYHVERERTLEEIPTLELSNTSPYYNKYGDKVTSTGIAWEERTQDMEYLYGLTHAAEPPDPADWDDFHDRDRFDGHDDDDDEEGEGERV